MGRKKKILTEQQAKACAGLIAIIVAVIVAGSHGGFWGTCVAFLLSPWRDDDPNRWPKVVFYSIMLILMASVTVKGY